LVLSPGSGRPTIAPSGLTRERREGGRIAPTLYRDGWARPAKVLAWEAALAAQRAVLDPFRVVESV
jgi:hypothetical protein